MISKEELDKMDVLTLEKEIKSRRELMDQMVGWLYPAILADEIIQLQERLTAS
jgi:hypothetical protein